MSILFDSTIQVNRVNRAFGLGLGVYRPHEQRAPYTGADLAWLAEQHQAQRDADAAWERRMDEIDQAERDAEIDAQAREALERDEYERWGQYGCC